MDSLADEIGSFLRDLPVYRHQRTRDASFVFLGSPDYYWQEFSPRQNAAKLELNRSYSAWVEVFRTTFRGASEDVVAKIQDADQGIRLWLGDETQGSNFSLHTDPDKVETNFRKDLQPFVELLDILDVTGPPLLIAVPDTNVLLDNADPASWRSVIDQDDFTFLLLPSVLAELDKLKIEHRNEAIKEKAKKAITRIKGWRNQGSLGQGVKTDKTITIKSRAAEPRVDDSLSWLDRDNQDDRIIASVLEIQSEHPSSSVVILTGDINLLNKADTAMINVLDV